jgi:hypothetical protein
MKKILAAFFALAATSAFAQNISVTKIGIGYSFDQQLLPDQVYIHEFLGYSFLERGNNFTAGVTTELKLHSRLSLRTGLLYANRDYTGFFMCATCNQETMLDYLDNPGRQTIKQRYLEIPAVARFYFAQNQFGLFADAGIASNFLVQNESSGNPSESEVKSNNFILNAEVGIGVSYTIVKYIEISITTVYRNSITTYIYTDNMQLRSFGVTGGISYRFRDQRPE